MNNLEFRILLLYNTVNDASVNYSTAIKYDYFNFNDHHHTAYSSSKHILPVKLRHSLKGNQTTVSSALKTHLQYTAYLISWKNPIEPENILLPIKKKISTAR